jgi:hypothetical protein
MKCVVFYDDGDPFTFLKFQRLYMDNRFIEFLRIAGIIVPFETWKSIATNAERIENIEKFIDNDNLAEFFADMATLENPDRLVSLDLNLTERLKKWTEFGITIKHDSSNFITVAQRKYLEWLEGVVFVSVAMNLADIVAFYEFSVKL